MSTRSRAVPLISAVASFAMLSATALGANAEPARQASDLAGTWEFAAQPMSGACRIFLQPRKSDKGDYFVGVPPACRHSLVVLAKIGRWALPDASHLTLDDPAGSPVLRFDARGEMFSATEGGTTYILRPVGRSGRSAASVPPPGIVAPSADAPEIVPVARKTRPVATEPDETKSDLAGRYAVMREKRDTGCMVTLDMTKGKGGDRAQLAPGCRDQGIVIFDPSAWQYVGGELVLTARAGHKAHLVKDGVGAWKKDLKEGGKPLGLKKL